MADALQYFEVGMKVIHECGVAWNIAKQQKTVEWDVFQAIFLYLQDKVVEKPVLENGLCNPGFGVTLPHNRKRALGYVFKGSCVL